MSSRSDEEYLGSVHVSPLAIATIASNALLTSYGVVGMAYKNALNEFTAPLTRDPNHAIDVHFEEGQIVIDAYVIVAHGTRISSVASSVINAIRYNVEKSVQVSVHQVNVFVQGLRFHEDS